MKNNETYRLKNIIYENNPKNIADNGGVMNFDKKNRYCYLVEKILNIKRFKWINTKNPNKKLQGIQRIIKLILIAFKYFSSFFKNCIWFARNHGII